MIVETEQRQAPSEVPPSPLAANKAELSHANGRWGQSGAQLSILIPTFRDSAHALINRLAECDGAVDTEVIVYDDGSGDPELTSLMSAAIRMKLSPCFCFFVGRSRDVWMMPKTSAVMAWQMAQSLFGLRGV